MKRTPLKRKTPLRSKRKTPRRPAPFVARCSFHKCSKLATLGGLCKTHAVQLADGLVSLAVRERDGHTCTAKAGQFGIICRGRLEAAHIIGRGEWATRYDMGNVHTLCLLHHRWVDGHHADKESWACDVVGFHNVTLLRARAVAGARTARWRTETANALAKHVAA